LLVRPLAAAAVVFLAAAAAADVRLEVSGAVRHAGDDLELEVDLVNRGDTAAGPVTVEAELLGERDRATLTGGLAPGVGGRLGFHLPLDLPRPGVYPVTLLLDYSAADAAAAPAEASKPGEASLSQRAYLLVSLGAQAPEPALGVSAAPGRFGTYGSVPIEVASADGRAHRVRVRVETARGLRALDEPREIDVPAGGKARLEARLIRSGPPRSGPQGILVIAEAMDGEVHQTAVATASVDLVAEPPWLPGLRVPLAIAAAALVLATLAFEVLRRRPGA
jgi:hypothetical protein